MYTYRYNPDLCILQKHPLLIPGSNRDSLGTMPMALAGALLGCPRIPRNERFGCDSHARMHPKREMLSVPTQCVTENLLCLGGQCVCMSVSPQVSRIYYHCASATAGDQHLFHETLKDLQSGSQRSFRHFASTARTCGTQRIQDVVFCTARDALRCIKMGRCYNQWLAASHRWELRTPATAVQLQCLMMLNVTISKAGFSPQGMENHCSPYMLWRASVNSDDLECFRAP